MLHGFTGTHSTWDEPSRSFVEGSFLIIPDLPGHGRSGTSAEEHMDLASTSEAIALIISLVEEETGRKAALLGYSLGGRVALDLALRHQDLVKCLVLEGSSPGIEDDLERAERRRKDEALAKEIEARGIDWFVDYWENTPLFATQKRLPTDVIQAIRQDRLSNSSNGLAMSLRASGPGQMTPLWEDLGGLNIPVLLIVGGRDRAFVRVAEKMKSRIPDCKVAVVDDAGHCVHLERPAEFANLVVSFLKDRSAIKGAEGARA